MSEMIQLIKLNIEGKSLCTVGNNVVLWVTICSLLPKWWRKQIYNNSARKL